MHTTFEKLYHGFTLSEPEAYQLLTDICRKSLNPSQVSAVMTFYARQPISVPELKGFKTALLDLCKPVALGKDCLDVCGTGGDHKNTFNISTLSAFVLAASGIPIAKHGNYGASSISGSSDILKHFGLEFKTDTDGLNSQLDKYNLCFIHAPLFHPALKSVAMQRKEMGLRTFFNLLGPLVNPAQVRYQYIGVYSLGIARLYHYVLQQGTSHYALVHSLDGYDEVSLTSAFKFISNTKEKMIEPCDIGYQRILPEHLEGGNTIEASAKIFINVLKNEATEAQKQVVIINSAFARQCYTKEDLETAVAICQEALESGKAYILFKNLLHTSS